MFLARHTVELLLKGLIYRDCEDSTKIRIGSGKDKKSVDNTHNLSSLWKCYLNEKAHSIFPTGEESKRIEKAISSVSEIDIDSTKYRYPETKHTASPLNLEPIRIDYNATVSPPITNRIPLIEQSSNSTNVITAGETSLQRGIEIFELIEELFRIAEP